MDLLVYTAKTLVGLRPSFSAQVRWCEPGAHVLFLLASVVNVGLLNLADVDAVGWQFDRCDRVGLGAAGRYQEGL
jgi:hypothetical protein